MGFITLVTILSSEFIFLVWKLMGRILNFKQSSVILIIFLAGNVGLNPEVSLASFSVDVGNTFQYDIHEAFIDSSFGSDFFYYDGIYVELARIPVSSTVNIEVDEVSNTSVTYTLSYASLTHHDMCELNILTPFLKLIAYGTTMPIMLVSHWGSVIAGTAFEWWGEPFLETDSDTWSTLEELGNRFVTSFQSTSTDGIFIDIEFETKEVNREFSIEWFVNGSYIFTTTDDNLEFSYSGSIAYDMDTGVLLGVHLLGSSQGLVHDSIFDVSYEYLVEAKNYNLPDFGLRETSNQLPGFHWGVILAGLLFSIGIFKLRNKRKV